ncbi:hypothetical protein KKB69_02190 [Patescibacteria group bacterium]|nr:hypothetical protein [Patescibacteria group bacterium]
MASNFQLLKSPWLGEFENLLRHTDRDFTFVSPFLKAPAVKTIFKNRQSDFAIHGITSFHISYFERRASDLDAVKLLLGDTKTSLKNIQNLHAKIYIFDQNAAVITSANLTPAGFLKNMEAGLLIREPSMIREISVHVTEMFKNGKLAFDITSEIVDETEKILASIPETKQVFERQFKKREQELFKFVDETPDDKIFKSGTDVILKGLSGWKKDVFQCLLDIKGEDFNLKDVYGFENTLSTWHLKNNRVRPKIRQQLQVLRNMGLVEFSGRGVYKKLWR